MIQSFIRTIAGLVVTGRHVGAGGSSDGSSDIRGHDGPMRMYAYLGRADFPFTAAMIAMHERTLKTVCQAGLTVSATDPVAWFATRPSIDAPAVWCSITPEMTYGWLGSIAPM
jgi:hypothetical protein